MSSPISMVTVEYQCTDGNGNEKLGVRLGNDKEFAEKFMHSILVEKGLNPEVDDGRSNIPVAAAASAPAVTQPHYGKQFAENFMQSVVVEKGVPQQPDGSSNTTAASSASAVPHPSLQEMSQRPFKWSDDSTRILLAVVDDKKAYRPPLQKRKRRDLWELVTKAMIEKGYNVTWEIVHKKWHNLQDTYKRIRERQYTTGSDSVAWPYYDLFFAMLGDISDLQQQTIGSIAPNQEASIPSTSCQINTDSDKSADNSESNPECSLTDKTSCLPPGNDTIPQKSVSCKLRSSRKRKNIQFRKKLKKTAATASPSATTAPLWFLDYCERKEKSEKEWRDEFRTMMAERTSTIRNLTQAISGLIQSQNLTK